ncbi:MAG: hypothetical protein AABY27_02075 [Pseudomonadota bacterium]
MTKTLSECIKLVKQEIVEDKKAFDGFFKISYPYKLIATSKTDLLHPKSFDITEECVKEWSNEIVSALAEVSPDIIYNLNEPSGPTIQVGEGATYAAIAAATTIILGGVGVFMYNAIHD